MTAQKQNYPSPASIIYVLSIVLCGVGFLRVELELNEQKKRLITLETVAETKSPSEDANIVKLNMNPAVFQSNKHHRKRRQADTTRNTTEAKSTVETMLQINKLLSDLKPQLCQSKGDTCLSSLPGPPGPPGQRGAIGRRGRRGHKGHVGHPGMSGKQGPKGQKGEMGPTGKPGAKGDKGIMGSPGKSGKQGIMGPVGPQGDIGLKGRKGEIGRIGPAGKPGAKGDKGIMGSPGKSGRQGIMGPVGLKGQQGEIGPIGMPGPKGERGVDHHPKVRPRVSLHPGPHYAIEGSNVTLPTCQVTGYPAPVVTWRKTSGQLPKGRVKNTKSDLTIFRARKDDSGNYSCTAVNLLGSVEKKTLLVVVSRPRFTIKPPAKFVAWTGDSLTVYCNATGDPLQPVISWKQQGAQLPTGRSQQINGALVIRGLTLSDAGIYICTATSAGVFNLQTVTYIEVKRRIAKGRDCSSLLKSNHTQSGVYSVNPDGKGYFNVYCDMRTDGGGWTVFQRRQDGSLDFYRGWNDYKSGFGQLTGEFWLGNDKIHRLTAARPSSLRVELEDWNGVRVYAKYGRFNIGDEQAQYRLEVSSYSGTAGDSLTYNHNNMAFTTKDRDNDPHTINCAFAYRSAWWYKSCHSSNLNGRYLGDKHNGQGVGWWSFRYNLSLKFTEMKLKHSS